MSTISDMWQCRVEIIRCHSQKPRDCNNLATTSHEWECVFPNLYTVAQKLMQSMWKRSPSHKSLLLEEFIFFPSNIHNPTINCWKLQCDYYKIAMVFHSLHVACRFVCKHSASGSKTSKSMVAWLRHSFYFDGKPLPVCVTLFWILLALS